MMNILVTGGTGFTGYHLVKRLCQDGHTVTAFDNVAGLFDENLRQMGVHIVYGDIADVNAVTEAVKGMEIIFHLAAAFRGVNLPDAVYLRTNVDGTRIIAGAALDENVKRFIYCSTEGVHGRVPNPPADESSPIAPKDYYQYTKYEGEKVVAEYGEKGLNTVVVRPTAIYGPGDPGRFLMLFRQVKKGYFPMFGSGKITYHPVYIDNLVDAFVATMTREQALGQTYLIGDEEYVSLIQLVSMVGHVMAKKFTFLFAPYWMLLGVSCFCEWICKPFRITPPLFKRRAEWYWENRGFSIERAKSDLGYHPRVGLEEGLMRTKQWYEKNGYL